MLHYRHRRSRTFQNRYKTSTEIALKYVAVVWVIEHYPFNIETSFSQRDFDLCSDISPGGWWTTGLFELVDFAPQSATVNFLAQLAQNISDQVELLARRHDPDKVKHFVANNPTTPPRSRADRSLCCSFLLVSKNLDKKAIQAWLPKN
jgi:hypothetical protein